MSQENFATEFLSEHNNLRSKFNINQLELDWELSTRAQEHANYLAIKQSKLENSTDESVGENLYYLESDDGQYDAQHIIDYWLRKSNVDLNNLEKQTKTNHFTQIVWKSSEKLGVGVSRADNGAVYVVAFYYPRGNIVNYLEENVVLTKQEDNAENSDSNETNVSHDSNDKESKKKNRKTDDKISQILEKIVKKADKEKSGKLSLTKAKKVFQLINEKFHTNYTNMDAKKFFEKFENLDEEGKVGQKEFRKALHDLNLKIVH